jgi:hypothetical protein
MSSHVHSGTCACGKNNTAEAHGLQRDDKDNVIHRALRCDEVEAIRARVAADITRDAMSRTQRALTWVQGRSGEYTDAAYDAAWAAPSAAPVDGAAR